MILHELYFDGLGADGEPDRALRESLARDFGSVDRWRVEFVAMGKAMGGGSGWVLLTYSHRDRKQVNQWAADHTHSVAGATFCRSTCTSTRTTWTTALRRRSTSTRSWRTSTGRTWPGSIKRTRDEREERRHGIPGVEAHDCFSRAGRDRCRAGHGARRRSRLEDGGAGTGQVGLAPGGRRLRHRHAAN